MPDRITTDNDVGSVCCRARFAVLMSTFGRRGTLKTSVMSVVGQKFTDWVLVVVNDGGECVADIIDDIGDDRVFYFSRPHQGKSAALNFALDVSESEFIAYLDDDDLFFENHLQLCFEAFCKKPEAKVVCTQTVEGFWDLDAGGKVVNLKHRGVVYPGGFSRFELREKNRIPNLNIAHRRSLLEKSGNSDTVLFAMIDWDLWRRFSFFADFYTIPVPTGMYRSAIGRKNNIGALVQRDPVVHELIKRYIQSRLPGVSKVIRMQVGTQADTQADLGKKRLLVVVCGVVGDKLKALFDAQDAPAGSFKVVELACFENSGTGILAEFELVCFLTPDMVVLPGFVSAHLSAKRQGHGAFAGRIDFAPQLLSVLDPRSEPSLVSLVFSDIDFRRFYYVSNELCFYNLSFASELLDGKIPDIGDVAGLFDFVVSLGEIGFLPDAVAVLERFDEQSQRECLCSKAVCGFAGKKLAELAGLNKSAVSGFFENVKGAGRDFECARMGALVERKLYDALP